MAKLSELNKDPRVKLLLYGPSGVGKTVMACSFPGKKWVADFDNKITSAANFYKGTDVIENIDYDNYSPRGNMPAEEFNNRLEELKKLAKEGKFPYDTIILDSLTTFSDEVMKYLIASNPGIKPLTQGSVKVPGLQHYGIARLFFKQIIMEFLSLPCHAIITAHVQVDKDEYTGQLLRSPMMIGKLAHELPLYFGEVYHAHIKDGKHVCTTHSDDKYPTRSQLKGIPKEIKSSFEEMKPYL